MSWGPDAVNCEAPAKKDSRLGFSSGEVFYQRTDKPGVGGRSDEYLRKAQRPCAFADTRVRHEGRRAREVLAALGVQNFPQVGEPFARSDRNSVDPTLAPRFEQPLNAGGGAGSAIAIDLHDARAACEQRVAQHCATAAALKDHDS